MLLISSDNELRELQRAWCRGKEGESCAGGCGLQLAWEGPCLVGNHTGRNAAPGRSSAESRSIQKARGWVGNSERLGLSHGREEEQLEPSNRNFLIFWGNLKEGEPSRRVHFGEEHSVLQILLGLQVSCEARCIAI